MAHISMAAVEENVFVLSHSMYVNVIRTLK